MKREILYTMKMPYRQDFLLEGFRSAAICCRGTKYSSFPVPTAFP